VRATALLLVLLVACGPAHKSAPETRAAPWVQQHASTPWTLGPYEVWAHGSFTAREQQCLTMAVVIHWASWSTSRRGVLQVGRPRLGRIYLHPSTDSIASSSSRTPNIQIAGGGDAGLIRVRVADHRLPGLVAAFDQLQDPLLESLEPLDPVRWREVAAIEWQSMRDLFPHQQAIGCHQPYQP
jgi:hypothetical protein